MDFIVIRLIETLTTKYMTVIVSKYSCNRERESSIRKRNEQNIKKICSVNHR